MNFWHLLPNNYHTVCPSMKLKLIVQYGILHKLIHLCLFQLEVTCFKYAFIGICSKVICRYNMFCIQRNIQYFLENFLSRIGIYRRSMIDSFLKLSSSCSLSLRVSSILILFLIPPITSMFHTQLRGPRPWTLIWTPAVLTNVRSERKNNVVKIILMNQKCQILRSEKKDRTFQNNLCVCVFYLLKPHFVQNRLHPN